MDTLDYNAQAELFPGLLRMSRTQTVGYKRFDHAVGSIRFAIEELPAQALAGASLEVGEDRFNAEGIRRLYEHAGYPLDRLEPAAGPGSGREQGPARNRRPVAWRWS